MAANPENVSTVEAWAELLACPACHEAVRAEGERVVCAACGRAYPVVDGIPVLIVERAELTPVIEGQHDQRGEA